MQSKLLIQAITKFLMGLNAIIDSLVYAVIS